MNDIEFTDNSAKVKAAMDKAIIAFFNEVGGEVAAQAARRTRVDSGQLAGDWDYKIDEGAKTVTIGNPQENAIWEEFGTGMYALKGNGRKTPWKYKHPKRGWVTTRGKTPTRALFNAWEATKGKVEKQLQKVLKGLGS